MNGTGFLRPLFVILFSAVMTTACGTEPTEDVDSLATPPEVEGIKDDVEATIDAIEVIPIDGIDPLGTWEVVSFEGGIRDERVGGGIEILCDYYSNTYQPALSSEDTFIHFAEMSITSNPDFGDIPEDMILTFNSFLETTGIFVFSFGFDNGYHSNRALEDLRVQFMASELIPGLVSAMMGGFDENKVLGEVRSKAPGGGENVFQVSGTFVSPERLEGEWSFEETTSLPGNTAPECTSAAEGFGTWSA
ncbi:MAG: hypothetical protein E4G99_12235, partial [Anaerolineales bacterium]